MRARMLWCLLLISSVGVAGLEGASETAPAASAANRLAGESLAHQARSLGHLRSGTIVARRGRMGVLLKRARRYTPDDPRLNCQLVDLYESLGELDQAAAAAGRCLEPDPGDYALALRWIRLTRAGFDKSEQHIAFLAKVAADKRYEDALRAAAYGWMADLHHRQGDKSSAVTACRRALVLDAYQPLALSLVETLKAATGPSDPLAQAATAFAANPRDMHAAAGLAWQLVLAGRSADALVFYEHAFAVSQARPPGAEGMERLLVDYINTLLDVGRARQVVDRFSGLIPIDERSVALHALMAEAYRSLSLTDKAASHVAAMGKIYESWTVPGKARPAERTAELGWYFLHFRRMPKEALRWAEEAARIDASSPFVVRVLGAAELAAGKAQGGTRRLTNLIGTDPYAASILARYYFDKGQALKGREALLRGASGARTGPAWRALAAIALEEKVSLPLRPKDPNAARVLAQLPPQAMQMGRYPERFIKVTLSAVRQRVMPGEPIEITVTLTNVSDHHLPLGQSGLFDARVFLGVRAKQLALDLPHLTVVILPAPKYLAPGQKVSRTTRIDVGPAEMALQANPLAEVTLTVSAMLDPLQHGREFISSAENVRILPVKVRRMPLLDATGATPARALLSRLQRDIRTGSAASKLLAARKIASLLAYTRRAEMGKVTPPLPPGLNKSAVLARLGELVKSPSSLARAEAIAALHVVDLDDEIIAALAPCIQDRNGLVRMRLVELLASKRTKGHTTILDLMAHDTDPEVREMAGILRPPRK